MQQGSHLWSWLLPTGTMDPLDVSGCDFQRISSPRNLQTSFGYKVTLLPPWWPSGETNLHDQLLSISLTVQAGASGSLPHSTRVWEESGLSPQPHFSALTHTFPLLCHLVLVQSHLWGFLPHSHQEWNWSSFYFWLPHSLGISAWKAKVTIQESTSLLLLSLSSPFCTQVANWTLTLLFFSLNSFSRSPNHPHPHG